MNNGIPGVDVPVAPPLDVVSFRVPVVAHAALIALARDRSERPTVVVRELVIRALVDAGYLPGGAR